MKAVYLFCILLALSVAVQGQVCGKDAGNALCTAPDAPCCSQYGYCGNTDTYCGAGCQSGCDGQVVGKPCSNETLKAPGTSGNNGAGDTCSIRYTINECELQEMIESQCTNCSAYISHIITAMERYDLNCPVRIATFIAQVRHETAGLNTFYQPADNGAGAIHMIPGNYRVACTQIPEMKQAFTAAFPSCSETDKCQCGTDPEASVIVGRPELAFLTGGWWFKTGSEQMLGFNGCGDLRINADVGKGTLDPPTGYYEVSRCIFGSLANDNGLSQRLAYFDAAWNVAKNFGVQDIAPSVGSNNPTGNTNTPNSNNNNSPSSSNNPIAKASSGASDSIPIALLGSILWLAY